MEPLISVVVPSYNYERYIGEALASVAAQTYPNIELVVIDDASKDGSVRVARNFIEKNKTRFANTILQADETNAGAHAAINRGIALCSGEYAAVLNADDKYESNRFEAMMRAMKEKSASWGFSKVKCIGGHSEKLRTREAAYFEGIQKKLAGKRHAALAAMGENVAVSTGNLLFSRTLFNRLRGFRNFKYVHDYDFFLRACLISEPAFASDTAYLYRLHGNNTFLSLQKEGVRENRMVWMEFYGRVQREKPNNRTIAENPDYAAEFRAAAAEEGKKKQTLFTLAKMPLARAGISLLKKVYKIERY